jgi:Zn-dependent protease
MGRNFKGLFRNVNPSIIIIIVILLGNRMLNSSQSPLAWLESRILMLPGIIIGLTFHEAAHGYVSYWLGDPTPKCQNRLSFNPTRHIDPIGFLALMFAGFGWGQPVQINPMYYKHRRRDEFLVAIAGVTMNFIIAVCSYFLLKVFIEILGFGRASNIEGAVIDILLYTITINATLMFFNLIPVPPLDGFGIVTQIFDLTKYSWYYPLYKNGFFILMILIVFGVVDAILTPEINWFVKWLSSL